MAIDDQFRERRTEAGAGDGELSGDSTAEEAIEYVWFVFRHTVPGVGQPQGHGGSCMSPAY